MYISELTKDTKILRVINGEYLVDVSVKDGVKTIRTTKNPYLAQPITVEEMYKELYNSLSSEDIKEVIEAHKVGKDSYNTIIGKVRYNGLKDFKALRTASIDYGYTDDIDSEAKLLKQLGLSWMIQEEKIAVESIDESTEVEEDLPNE